jgi:hypothetical protein
VAFSRKRGSTAEPKAYEMKFLCLICAEKVMEQMPAADAEKHFQEYVKFTEWIKAAGHFIGANRLKPAAAATTVRVRDGKVSTTDGPIAEDAQTLALGFDTEQSSSTKR